MNLCTVEGCEADKGGRRLYCQKHYTRMRKHGTTDAPSRLTAEQRFWAKVEKSATCWHWRGAISDTEYGNFWLNGSTVVAHRLAYEFVKGPVPAGMQLDHLCRNRGCVNPDHLEPVSQAENIRRGFAPTAFSARTNICRRGLHLIEGDNEHIHPTTGYRLCRACARARRERNRNQKKAS